jgi:hypothetical protein
MLGTVAASAPPSAVTVVLDGEEANSPNPDPPTVVSYVTNPSVASAALSDARDASLKSVDAGGQYSRRG